jgi:hypothetical protein
MTEGLRFPELCVPAVSRHPALILRPWRAADIPALATEMSREYPTGGIWPRPGERLAGTAAPPGGAGYRAGPAGERDAAPGAAHDTELTQALPPALRPWLPGTSSA